VASQISDRASLLDRSFVGLCRSFFKSLVNWDPVGGRSAAKQISSVQKQPPSILEHGSAVASAKCIHSQWKEFDWLDFAPCHDNRCSC
jgi:hypothetical protein